MDDRVYLSLPPQDRLDALLATEVHRVSACETSGGYSVAASPVVGALPVGA